LAACGSEEAPEAPAANALDVITVGGTSKAPTLAFKTKPISVKETTTKVVTVGKGAKLTKANSVMVNYTLVNGKDGKQIETSYGEKAAGMDLSSTQLMPGLTKGLTGQLIGSRILVAIPPADAFGAEGNSQIGFGATDTAVFLVDLVSASTPLTTASGTAVPAKSGLPTVAIKGAEAAKITVPKTAAPTKLIVQPLIRGKGPVVKTGQNIKVSYTAVLWKDGKQVDASATHGGPQQLPIGVGQGLPGWDKGLVGQTVGSRILLVIPPAEGFKEAGNPPLVSGKDTLVYVFDILSAL